MIDIEALIIASMLVLFRVAAFLAFLPPMAGRGLPNTVKIGLAGCWSMGEVSSPMLSPIS